MSSKSLPSNLMEKILLFLSNGITPEQSIDEFRRTPLFNLLLFIGITFFTIFAIIMVYQQQFVFAIVEFSISFFLILCYVVARKKGITRWASTAIFSIFYIVFLLLGIGGGPDGNGFLWIYTFPLAATFLSGPRQGTIWSLSLLIIILICTFFSASSTLIFNYDPILLLRMSATFLIVVLFSAITDGILFYTYKKMQESHLRLEETIEELNRSKEELHQQAIHDGLTGIYNRRFFNQTITSWTIQALRHRSDTALFMIDVDKFKSYNDRFGHLKGDAVLKTVASTINESLRRESDMVFRYGGEEFAIILTKTTPSTTQEIAETIMNNLRRCNIPHPDAPTGVISVSIGIAEWRPSEDDILPEKFIEVADTALYEAKAAGRNCIISKNINAFCTINNEEPEQIAM